MDNCNIKYISSVKNNFQAFWSLADMITNIFLM